MRTKHLLWIVPLVVLVFVMVALFPIGRGGSNRFPGVVTVRLESSEVAGLTVTSENRSYQGLLVGFGASRQCLIAEGEETCGYWSREVFFGFKPFSPGSRPLVLGYYRPGEESVGLLAYFLENSRAEDWLVNFYVQRSADSPRFYEGYLIRNDSEECVPFQEFSVDMADLSVARQRGGCTDPRGGEPAVGLW